MMMDDDGDDDDNNDDLYYTVLKRQTACVPQEPCLIPEFGGKDTKTDPQLK